MRKLVGFTFLVVFVVTLTFPFIHPANAATVFSDDFSGDLSQWTVSSGESSFWTIESGELSGGGRGQVQIVAGDASLANYELKAKVKVVSYPGKNPFAGVLFRFVDSSNWMWVGMYTLSDFHIQIMKDGVRIVDASIAPYAFALDTFYEFRVVADGNNFEFYVNDGLQGGIVDSTFPQGKIGLYPEWQTLAHFDDVNVENPIPNFNVVPEYPLGTILGLIMMLAALGVYKSKRIHIHL